MFALGVLGLLAIFYISTFIDMMDKLFRGETTTAVLLRYFAFATPRFIYFVVPMSVLVSALVTVGVMTKNSELLVLRACGISLYRAMAPLVGFALLASVSLFLLQDSVLASTNREADRLEAKIRGWNEQSTPLTQHWRARNRRPDLPLRRLRAEAAAFRPSAHLRRRSERVAASLHHLHERGGAAAGTPAGWRKRVPRLEGQERLAPRAHARGPARGGRRTKTFRCATRSSTSACCRSSRRQYFESSVPKADQMTLGELRTYISQLRASGVERRSRIWWSCSGEWRSRW